MAMGPGIILVYADGGRRMVGFVQVRGMAYRTVRLVCKVFASLFNDANTKALQEYGSFAVASALFADLQAHLIKRRVDFRASPEQIAFAIPDYMQSGYATESKLIEHLQTDSECELVFSVHVGEAPDRHRVRYSNVYNNNGVGNPAPNYPETTDSYMRLDDLSKLATAMLSVNRDGWCGGWPELAAADRERIEADLSLIHI